jgi:glycosyltransferase involved in cell wall biosynthesis
MKRGHEVVVYTGSGSSDEFEIVNLSKIPFVFSPGYEAIIPKSICIDADIVHVHTVYTVGWMGMTQKKPRVVTTHTLPRNMFPNHFTFLRPIGWEYLISFYSKADRVVCQTDKTAEKFRQHGLKKSVSIISSGVDIDFFRKGSAKNFKKKYGVEGEFVLHTARLSPEKRPEFALKACQELGLKIVLTSNGPLKKKLEQKYPEAIFLEVPREDLKDVYSAAKVFVLTSAPEVECEGLGPLEAMSSGVPVVCSDVPHIVRDGDNGFLFKTYDEFKQKLETLWHDDELQKKLSERGRKTAKERDIKKSITKLIEVYKELL